ncbi:MAG: universal stress protein [Steroidobacteraceae bacterium]
MSDLKRILVAVKAPGARSQPTARKAAQIAAATGATLELFHAITTPLYVDAFAMEGLSLKDTQKQWRTRAVKQLERHAAALRESGATVEVSCDWDFPAYEAVVRRAARTGADLIIAERHADKHVMPWLLRFNDWELLRRSPVPVLLVKHGQPWKKPAVLAAIDPQHSFAKPAKLDDAILDAAAELAGALGGAMHAVHAYPAATPALIDYGTAAEKIGTNLEKRAAAAARKAFDAELADRGIPRSRQHLVAGHPVDVIPKLAKRLGARLVVMGGISRSGLKRLVIGNVAEQVLDALPCDVLVMKPERFKARVPATPRGVQLLATPPYV